MFKGKRVLVAGGTGFVGANLIIRLLSLGAEVRSTLHIKGCVIRDDRVEYCQCNLLRTDDCINAVSGMDYVFMCAANTSGAAVMASTPLVHVTPNIIMNARMLEAAYEAKVKKFIWLSSGAAYPPTGSRPVKEDEMFNGNPFDTYFGVGWMKRYTEILCRLYSEKLNPPMKTVVLRPSNIYGPYDKFDFGTSHVMAATVRKVVERHNPVQIWGTGDDVRDFIYIDDFIDAVLLAAEEVETYNPINIGFGKGHSVKEILQTALDVDGFNDANTVYDKSKPSMIPVRLIDTRKAEKVLGFRARTDIREGIGKTIEWYRKTCHV